MRIDDIKDIVAFIKHNATDLKVAVDDIMELGRFFKPEIVTCINAAVDAAVDAKARAITRYIDTHHFTREEAFQLVLKQESEITSIIKKAPKK